MCADADFNSRFAELPKQLRLALLAIPSAAEQRQVLALVEETLDASRAEGELQFNLEVDFSDWTEGVEAFKHLKIEEIAAALGCSAGTVASRLNRAHQALARRLAHLRDAVR